MLGCFIMTQDQGILIGKRIRERREILGMSQIELAKAAGKESATYIALIENGERRVRTEDILLIARALETTTAVLTGEEEGKAAPEIRYALQADPNLSADDRKTLLHIIDTMKKAHKQKHHDQH